MTISYCLDSSIFQEDRCRELTSDLFLSIFRNRITVNLYSRLTNVSADVFSEISSYVTEIAILFSPKEAHKQPGYFAERANVIWPLENFLSWCVET